MGKTRKMEEKILKNERDGKVVVIRPGEFLECISPGMPRALCIKSAQRESGFCAGT